MPAGCLDRTQIIAIASQRCTEKELADMRQHLAECARCRLAVAARAGGRRGPGDTVLLKKPKQPTLPTALKLGSVGISLLVLVGIWRFGGSPTPRGAAVPEIAAASPSSETPQTTSHETATLSLPVRSPPPPPTVAPIAVIPADAGGVEPSAPVQREAVARPRSHTPRAAVSQAPIRRAAEAPTNGADFDFGIDQQSIDERSSTARSTVVNGRVIRTTLE